MPKLKGIIAEWKIMDFKNEELAKEGKKYWSVLLKGNDKWHACFEDPVPEKIMIGATLEADQEFKGDYSNIKNVVVERPADQTTLEEAKAEATLSESSRFDRLDMISLTNKEWKAEKRIEEARKLMKWVADGG